MPDEIREHDQQFCEEMASRLHSHFDTVCIFVSRSEPDGKTMGYTTGRGNWYARIGQVGYWLDQQTTEDSDDDDIPA